jgi:hypothetical protein
MTVLGSKEHIALNYWFNKNNDLEKKVQEFYHHIEHGDEQHKKWLKDEFEKFFGIKIKSKKRKE